MIGSADVYLVAPQVGGDAAGAAMFRTARPARGDREQRRAQKGGAPQTLAAMHDARASRCAGQLHRATARGGGRGYDARIANPDETTSAWIKPVGAKGRVVCDYERKTGVTVEYSKRR